MVIVGGGVAQAGEILIGAMREAMYRRSRSLATQSLQIVRAEMGRTAGLVGAARAVVDELFAPEYVRSWIEQGVPAPSPRGPWRARQHDWAAIGAGRRRRAPRLGRRTPHPGTRVGADERDAQRSPAWPSRASVLTESRPPSVDQLAVRRPRPRVPAQRSLHGRRRDPHDRQRLVSPADRRDHRHP